MEAYMIRDLLRHNLPTRVISRATRLLGPAMAVYLHRKV